MPGPRKGAKRSDVRRPSFTLRLSEDGLAFVTTEAQRLGVQRSEVIRAALRHWSTLPERQRKV
ncbi:MAG TPA: ribbon-helix-helix protein, CopG family [Nocardioidaceae bacterium]|nr:ribbon-helix-helix protein, CopG family [Nocardioidaceae bacterium]